MSDDQCRRLRVYTLPKKDLVTLLNWYIDLPELIEKLPRLWKLPVNAYVISTRYDYSRMAYCFMVTSSEFDIVPEGDMIPVVHGELQEHSIDVAYKQCDTIAGAVE